MSRRGLVLVFAVAMSGCAVPTEVVVDPGRLLIVPSPQSLHAFRVAADPALVEVVWAREYDPVDGVTRDASLEGTLAAGLVIAADDEVCERQRHPLSAWPVDRLSVDVASRGLVRCPPSLNGVAVSPPCSIPCGGTEWNILLGPEIQK